MCREELGITYEKSILENFIFGIGNAAYKDLVNDYVVIWKLTDKSKHQTLTSDQKWQLNVARRDARHSREFFDTVFPAYADRLKEAAKKEAGARIEELKERKAKIHKNPHLSV